MRLGGRRSSESPREVDHDDTRVGASTPVLPGESAGAALEGGRSLTLSWTWRMPLRPRREPTRELRFLRPRSIQLVPSKGQRSEFRRP